MNEDIYSLLFKISPIVFLSGLIMIVHVCFKRLWVQISVSFGFIFLILAFFAKVLFFTHYESMGGLAALVFCIIIWIGLSAFVFIIGVLLTIIRSIVKKKRAKLKVHQEHHKEEKAESE